MHPVGSLPADAGTHRIRLAQSKQVNRILQCTLWLLVPIACHLGFSWIGFNPTDEGWLLAVARRIAAGQVPHRDFVFVRPAFSAILEIPLVWFGGDYVIWWSRLWGWVTLAAAVWLWSGRTVNPRQFGIRYALYAIALLLCAHVYPIMAWHTLDGMFFATSAVVIAGKETGRARAAAFLFVGLAGLCRQNFGVFAPLLMLSIGGPVSRWVVAGAWSILPVALYAAAIAWAGAGGEFLRQVLAPSGFFAEVAIRRFVFNQWFGTAFLLGIALIALRQSRWWSRVPMRHFAPAALFAGAGLGEAICLWRFPYFGTIGAFALFGLVLGGVIIALVHGISAADRLTLVAGVGLAWVVSISCGYNNPALMDGVLLLLWYRLLDRSPAQSISGIATALLVLAPAVIFAFSYARQSYPYRDRNAYALTYRLGDVLAGGAGLRTNELTYATLSDLRRLTLEFKRAKRRYVVLTDCAAIWIRDSDLNPLESDWPQSTELAGNAKLLQRLQRDIQSLPPTSRILAQRYVIGYYAWNLAPITAAWEYSPLQTWVRQHCHKVAQTPFFDIYQPPTPPDNASRP